jgi:hypothetical protein
MLKEMITNHKKILNNFIDTFADSFKGSVPNRLQELKDDHETDERDDKYTVCTGLQAQCNATGVTPILRPPKVGL